jgi:hypothetical protein
MKNAVNELSFLLITHTDYFDTRFGCYGFLKLGYGAELFWTAWTLERNPSFKRLDYGFVAYLPSSSTPTQSHDFGNHSNGYDRPKTVLVRS